MLPRQPPPPPPGSLRASSSPPGASSTRSSLHMHTLGTQAVGLLISTLQRVAGWQPGMVGPPDVLWVPLGAAPAACTPHDPAAIMKAKGLRGVLPGSRPAETAVPTPQVCGHARVPAAAAGKPGCHTQPGAVPPGACWDHMAPQTPRHRQATPGTRSYLGRGLQLRQGESRSQLCLAARPCARPQEVVCARLPPQHWPPPPRQPC